MNSRFKDPTEKIVMLKSMLFGALIAATMPAFAAEIGELVGKTGPAAAGPGKQNLVVLTDPGGDDVVCGEMIAKAARAGKFNLLAVVTHYGCTDVKKATRTGFCVYRSLLSDVPIVAGSAQPGTFPPGLTAKTLPHYYDNKDGSAHGYCGIDLPMPAGTPADLNGGLARVAELIAESENVHLVILGPCTDALPLLKNEAAAKKIARLTVMGGALGYGNSGPKFAAEFNVFLDAPAFVETLKLSNARKLPVNLVPWDVPLIVWKDEQKFLSPADSFAEDFLKFLARYFDIHHGDGVPGDPAKEFNKRGPAWYVSDAKVALFLSYPDLFLQAPLTLWVSLDQSQPDSYGATLITVPDKNAEALRVIYTLPTNSEVASQQMLREIGLEVKRP